MKFCGFSLSIGVKNLNLKCNKVATITDDLKKGQGRNERFRDFKKIKSLSGTQPGISFI